MNKFAWFRSLFRRPQEEPKEFTDADFDRLCKELYNALSAQDKKRLKSAAHDSLRSVDNVTALDMLISLIHHSYGRHLRNTYSLWDENSPIAKWFKSKHGITHADDMSSIIITGIVFHDDHVVRDRFITEQIEHYNTHWSKFGNDYR